MKKDIKKLTDQFFAVCPIGLEEILAEELQNMKISEFEIRKGGIQFSCSNFKAIELILTTRIASRVYKQLFQFEIQNEKNLYHHAKDIKWKSILTPDETFKITTIQNRSQDGKKWSGFKSPLFLSQTLKDALVDNLRNKYGERPSVDKDRPDVSIILHVEPVNDPESKKEMATISVDMCGFSLHERAYRKSRTFEAPLKENLAAGIIKLTGYTDQVLIDPMCGSGTLLIEAMLIRANIPASFMRLRDYHPDHREWDFQRHTYLTKDKYLLRDLDKLIKDLQKQVDIGFTNLKKLKNQFIANDNSNDSIKQFILNLRELGLVSIVQIENQDAADFAPSNIENAIVVTNPPYGDRLGDKKELEELYYKFGENLKANYKTCDAYILAGEKEHLKKISLRTSKKFVLYNGGIETRLAKYELY